MASVYSDKQGNKTIQFKGLDGKRKSIRLGKARQRTVDTVKTHVEELLEARTRGRSPYDETTAWISRICANSSDLYDKLAKHDLVPKRSAPKETTLGPFLTSYVAARTDVKGGTTVIYAHTKRCLVEYFGAGRSLADITPGEADDWRRWLVR